MKRTKRPTLKRTKTAFKKIVFAVGEYVRVSTEDYMKIRKLSKMGAFHTAQGHECFFIKIINKKILKAFHNSAAVDMSAGYKLQIQNQSAA